MQPYASAGALFSTLTIPSTWGRRYAKEARAVPACSDFPTVEDASGLMRAFVDPVLRGEAIGMHWSPDSRSWA